MTRPTGTTGVIAAVTAAAGVALLVAGCSTAGRAAGPHDSAPAVSTAAAVAATSPHKPLAGVTIAINPGHNGHSHLDPAYLDRKIWNGREYEDCDTTGTETNAGYTEALFNWRVATFLRTGLRQLGATVVMTRHNNHGVGPCVNTRAFIVNRSHAAVAINIHADGGPASGRGFTVLEPVRDKQNRKVVASSAHFGADVRRAMLNETSMPTSSYDGVNGITHRDNLAGLNLTTVPEVLLEAGNMRNSRDARMLVGSVFQHREAVALVHAIRTFLHR